MSDHWIYADFESEINALTERLYKELSKVPKKLLPLADYYLKERLMFFLHSNEIRIDPRFGRPVPYLVYWFSETLKLHDKRIVDQLALSLCYISVVVSIRDDLADGRVVLNGTKVSEHAHIALANYFYSKYYNIFRNIFSQRSIFWSILCYNLNQWSRYETWDFLLEKEPKYSPLTESFLRRSSDYLVAITVPTLAAIAILTKKYYHIPRLRNFLIDYCMGWKITDDLRDWRSDLSVPNRNHSTVIFQAMKYIENFNPNSVDTELVESLFLINKEFIDSIYAAVLRNYNNARKDVQTLNSRYLNEFIDSQIEFYSEERNLLIKGRESIKTSLATILNK
jgi:hypothetical protein